MDAKVFSVSWTLLTLLCLSTTLQGGTIPGRWEKVDSLAPQTPIVIKLDSGDRFECQLLTSDPESLTILAGDGDERKLPKSAVRKIETVEKKRGPLWTGPLIGGAVGGAVGGVLAATIDDADNKDKASAVLLFTAIGAGIGLGVDAAVAGPQTLYRAR